MIHYLTRWWIADTKDGKYILAMMEVHVNQAANTTNVEEPVFIIDAPIILRAIVLCLLILITIVGKFTVFFFLFFFFYLLRFLLYEKKIARQIFHANLTIEPRINVHKNFSPFFFIFQKILFKKKNFLKL